MTTRLEEAMVIIIFLVMLFLIVIASLYALFITFKFAFNNIKSQQPKKVIDNNKLQYKNENIEIIEDISPIFPIELKHITPKNLLLNGIGLLYATLMHIFIFLATCTSSHDGAVDFFEQPRYSAYGVSFANLYYDYAFNMIWLIVGLMFFSYLLKNRCTFFEDCPKSIFDGYQISFVVLFFVPANIIAFLFAIPNLLDMAFNHFINVQNIDNQNLVYTLKNHILNPKLGQTSYFRFMKLIFWNSMGLFLWIKITNFFDKK